jgi:ribosomal protein S7
MLMENDFFIFKKLFHILIKKGKKEKALNILLKVLSNLKYNKNIKLSTKEIIHRSFSNIKPLLHIKKVRKSSRVFYLPKLITTEQKISLSIH